MNNVVLNNFMVFKELKEIKDWYKYFLDWEYIMFYVIFDMKCEKNYFFL